MGVSLSRLGFLEATLTDCSELPSSASSGC